MRPKGKVSFCERDGFGEAVKIQMAKLCALEATLRPNTLQGNKTDVIGIESKKFQFWCWVLEIHSRNLSTRGTWLK